MTFRPIVRSICVVGICLLAGRSIAAQSADVVIRGLATDESRAGVPGVTITATNTETGLQRSTITDMTGRYAILSVPAGTYDIASELSGFQTVVRRQQTFNVGTTITIDFTMLVAGLAETIEVRAEAPVLQATNSTVSRIVQKAEIDSLPVINRNFSDLAALAPGVQASGGGVSIGSSFASQTGYRVDGVSTQGWNTGGQVVPFAQDWIQEFSVVTRQFSAEYRSGLRRGRERGHAIRIQPGRRALVQLLSERQAERDSRLRGPERSILKEAAGWHGRRSRRQGQAVLLRRP